jgi:hypothetical protein
LVDRSDMFSKWLYTIGFLGISCRLRSKRSNPFKSYANKYYNFLVVERLPNKVAEINGLHAWLELDPLHILSLPFSQGVSNVLRVISREDTKLESLAALECSFHPSPHTGTHRCRSCIPCSHLEVVICVIQCFWTLLTAR